MKPGYRVMLAALGRELEHAVTAANERRTRTAVLRVKAIRHEIKRVSKGSL